jgi:predicted O-methyltransferase YrrM
LAPAQWPSDPKYDTYYELLMELVRPEGVIIVDNLFCGVGVLLTSQTRLLTRWYVSFSLAFSYSDRETFIKPAMIVYLMLITSRGLLL